MRILSNSLAIVSYKGIQSANKGLQESMSRLSSGKKIDGPGDSPSDFGIAQRLSYQIRNSAESRKNLDNAKYLINSTDDWLQTSTDILRRMSELSVSSLDGAKSLADRKNLDTEFQQLKVELSRISSDAKYNGIQVAGRDQLLSYDEDQKTFFFSQLDGEEKYTLPVKVLSGLKSTNQQDFLFNSSKPFTLSQDGASIWYADSNNNLTSYNIFTGDIHRDTSDSEKKNFDIDETGRLFYATETASGSGTYLLKQQDVSSWTLDNTLVAPGDINDMASPEFSVYENHITYMNTAGNIVSRSLQQLNEVKVVLAAADLSFTGTDGKFTLSEDGKYMADVPAAGSLRIVNLETKQINTLTIPTAINIQGLKFGADGKDLVYVDSAEGSIHHVDVTGGETPILSNDTKLQLPTGATGFSGVSLEGNSNRSIFRVHNGPDADQQSVVTTGDVRLYTLGLTRSDILSTASANESLARTQHAINLVTIQRANIGAEASRLEHISEILQSYSDNVSQTEGEITDTNVAEETANLASWQIRQQAAIAMMAQANQIPKSILNLLQG